ncbi:MAG: TetR/AcrR family transcriptional regulator [Fibrobacter sp.]|nr:TetR/AcrR family transcriptional regulator [Fibrobacter sp.]
MARPKQFDPEVALLKAMNLFWEHGFNGTSIEELVQATGVNRASLYSTYGDKRSLFIKALSCYRHKTLEPQIKQMTQSGDILSYLERMLNPETINDPCSESQLTLGCFLANCVTELGESDPEVTELTQEFFQEIRQAIENGIAKEMQTRPWNTDSSPAEVAGVIFTILMGVRVLNRNGLELDWAQKSIKMLRKVL